MLAVALSPGVVVKQGSGVTVLAYILAGGMALVLFAFAGLIVAGNLKSAADRQALAWVILDADGREVGPGRFDDARPFAHGLAPVEIDGKWGYVDASGEQVIPPTFVRAQPFDADGRAEVGVGAWFGVIDRSGRLFHPGGLTSCGPFDDGFAVAVEIVELRPSTTDLHSAGLLRADGRWQVEPAPASAPTRWLTARGPSEGTVVAELPDKRWALLDLDGQPLFEARFEELLPSSEGLVAARRDGRWGYVDHSGQFVVPPRWRSARPFADGLAVVEGPNGMWLIDREGEQRVGPHRWIRSVSEGLAAVEQDGEWGFVDPDGRWVIAPAWLDVGEEGFQEGRARVARRGELREREWAWIDREGQVVGAWYADITPWSEARALARVPR